MSSATYARSDTEGERRTSTSQHLVTHRDRVVHKIAQSGFACRSEGVQSLGYGLGPCLERVIESRFEAVISMHSNRRSLARAVAVVTVVAALTTACSSATTPPTQSPTASSTAPTPSTTSPSPTPSPTAEAATAALASYDAFWTAKVASQADPTRKPGPDLATYSIDKALADAQATVLLLRRSGVEMHGQPRHDAKATAVNLGDPKTVSIQDCLDSTDWTPVYAATGKSALAPGQSLRVVVDSLATVYNGHWVIRESVAHRDQPC